MTEERDEPEECPVCGGQGTIQKPPWIAGDCNGWYSATAGPYTCQACGGSGIIWGRGYEALEGGPEGDELPFRR